MVVCRRAGFFAMVFNLTRTPEQNWNTLKGHARLAQVIEGVRFKEGLQERSQRIAWMFSGTQHLQKLANEFTEVGSGVKIRPQRAALMLAARRRDIYLIVVWKVVGW